MWNNNTLIRVFDIQKADSKVRKLESKGKNSNNAKDKINTAELKALKIKEELKRAKWLLDNEKNNLKVTLEEIKKEKKEIEELKKESKKKE